MNSFALPIELKMSRTFLDDARQLPVERAANLTGAIRLLQAHGVTYPSLKTRPIARNPDPRFRLMNVDDAYRIVAAVEDRHVLLLKVGNHDETERWGERASLKDFEERLAVDPVLLARERRRAAEPTADELFEPSVSLAEITRSDAVSDLITDCLEGVLDGWRDGTIEDWMIFLSPVQRRAVDRAVGGPSRVTGGPGTGKTVVGLHRAAAFARDLAPGERILMTSFVKTIPEVLAGLFERLAPDLADRVRFKSVHSLAWEILGPHGPNVDEAAARSRFRRRLEADRNRQRQLVFGARLSEEYLWEEVTRVIEGRGVASQEAYLSLERHGRKRPLSILLRRLIWDLYEEYRAFCDDRSEPVVDWNRVLQLALDHVRQHPPAERYAAIIVDEAQDITEVGVRFLLELLAGGPKGRIMLIGDAGQRIYPGGYRLADLGLEIRGRSFQLSVCYRSTDEIMRAVGGLGQYVSTEEFGEDGVRGLLTSTVRSGPRPRLHRFWRGAEEAAWLVGELDPDDPDLDATAILVPSNRLVGRWRKRLSEASIGSVGLDEYHGRPVPGVKVGTYHRAKGLEFKRVFLPGLDFSFPRLDPDDVDGLIKAASQLYVAMSRARDVLELSYAGLPSMLLEGVRAHVDLVEAS